MHVNYEQAEMAIASAIAESKKLGTQMCIEQLFSSNEQKIWLKMASPIYDEFMIAELPATVIVDQFTKLCTQMNGSWPGDNISAIPSAPEHT